MHTLGEDTPSSGGSMDRVERAGDPGQGHSVHRGPHGRSTRPRRERVTFSLRRRTIVPLAATIPLAMIGAFVLGFVLGRRDAAVAPAGSLAAPAVPSTTPARVAQARAEPGPVWAPKEGSGPAISAGDGAAIPPPGSVGTVASAPDEAEIVIEVGAPPSTGFGIQVGAYPDLDAAKASVRAHAQELRGLEIHIVPTDIPGRGVWHRVRVGVFASRTDAESARRGLSDGLARNALVVGYR